MGMNLWEWGEDGDGMEMGWKWDGDGIRMAVGWGKERGWE